ncbi:hypothetical protein Anapl_13556 [Anas platyrhynchos]|uniref:Uncharacterized protein n=1 Tax=Anas platyrhynchos TaxID=8839 RepID=R0L7J4_ANAPL|nr:hypothetical protein Anapl_13556 [Anas platyrhynchos]
MKKPVMEKHSQMTILLHTWMCPVLHSTSTIATFKVSLPTCKVFSDHTRRCHIPGQIQGKSPQEELATKWKVPLCRSQRTATNCQRIKDISELTFSAPPASFANQAGIPSEAKYQGWGKQHKDLNLQNTYTADRFWLFPPRPKKKASRETFMGDQNQLSSTAKEKGKSRLVHYRGSRAEHTH